MIRSLPGPTTVRLHVQGKSGKVRNGKETDVIIKARHPISHSSTQKFDTSWIPPKLSYICKVKLVRQNGKEKYVLLIAKHPIIRSSA